MRTRVPGSTSLMPGSRRGGPLAGRPPGFAAGEGGGSACSHV